MTFVAADDRSAAEALSLLSEPTSARAGLERRSALRRPDDPQARRPAVEVSPADLDLLIV